MGYGMTGFAEDYSYFLKYAYVTVMSIEQCATAYQNDPDLVLTQNDMCHFTSKNGDSCQVIESKLNHQMNVNLLLKMQGDSGGPIFVTTYRDFLMAIVKTGAACGSGAPGLGQMVSPYRPWILQKPQSSTIDYYCNYEK